VVEWPYWVLLVGIAVTTVLVGLRVHRPDAGRVRMNAASFMFGGLAVGALAFHCLAMFLPPLVPPVGPLPAAADEIRQLGLGSQFAYWLPATFLIAALRRLPAAAVTALAVVLVGVGITMFWPFPLAVHLAFIAAAVGTLAGMVGMTIGDASARPG
jgi:hypothetical protein